MPTYEYACQACGHAWEEIQRMSDATLETCPKCGEKKAQRLISQGNFILKGGGWYTTGGYGAPAKARSEDGAPAAPAAPATDANTPAKAPSTAPTPAASPASESTAPAKSESAAPSAPSGESKKSTPSTAPGSSQS